MTKFLAKMIASVFFIGYIPFASGSWCSLLCTVVLFVFNPTLLLQALLIVASFVLGTWSAFEGEKIWGKDNRRIVIDEFTGMLLTMFFIPINALNLFLGFSIFRAYDIFKPFPIKKLERQIQNGFGVMLDDVLAGIMANLTLRLILLMF
ncbi:MAG: phosphatidylglycerophosphatase A [Thermodesulfovibrionales bacterium]|nr:phosphatidylglycerophosphatase A [Thermodesulfovibrionales bacterium]